MFLYNMDFAMEWPRPLPPNVQLVGALLPTQAKPLPPIFEVRTQGLFWQCITALQLQRRCRHGVMICRIGGTCNSDVFCAIQRLQVILERSAAVRSPGRASGHYCMFCSNRTVQAVQGQYTLPYTAVPLRCKIHSSIACRHC